MAKKGSFSKVYDKNGDYVDVEAARFDGTRTFQMQGDVTASQTWNGDPSSPLTLNASIGAKKVTTDKINDKAVQAQQIDDGAVGLTQIATAAMNGTVQDNDSKLATHAAVKTYVDAQISGQGTYLGKHTVAEINAMVTDNLHNGDRVMTSDSGTINLGPGGLGFDVEAGEDLILYKSGSTVQWDSMDGNFKTKQTAVSDPTASGSTLEFIDSISQDENGEITASKKAVQDGTTSQKGVVQLEDSHSSTSTTKAATPKSVKEAYDLANTANTGAVKNVSYDSTNKKITKTINGTTSDVVSAATLKTDMALNNVDNTSDANKPVSTAQQAALDLKLDKTGDGKDVTATFTEASTRANIGTGEKLSVIFGKIKKWFTDLGTAAFKNVPASGNASSTEVVLGSDTRLSAGASAVQDVTVDGASVVNSSTKVAAVPNASTSAKGAVQLAGSIGATVASENNKAATEKAVRDALDGKTDLRAVRLTNSDDLNSIANTYSAGTLQVYNWLNTSVPANAPDTLPCTMVQYGIANTSTSKNCVQVVYPRSADFYFERICNSGTWSAWKKVFYEATSTYSSTGTQAVNGTAVASALSSYELLSNKVSSWQSTPDDTHYPSEKLVKVVLDAKADANKVVAIADAKVYRSGQSGGGWYKIAECSLNKGTRNISASWDVLAVNQAYSNSGKISLNYRYENSTGTFSRTNVRLDVDSWDALRNSIKVAHQLTSDKIIVEIWVNSSDTYSGFAISERNSDNYSVDNVKGIWTYTSYSNNGGSTAPVTDASNNVTVTDVNVVIRQHAIASPTNNNLVAMDANGLVKDSGLTTASVESAITSAGSAIQGVKVNNTTLTPDANKVVTVPLATTSADGAMSAADKTKLNGIAEGAEANVQADWNETDSSSDAFIKNKPYFYKATTTSVIYKVCRVAVRTMLSSGHGVGFEFITRLDRCAVSYRVMYKGGWSAYCEKTSGEITGTWLTLHNAVDPNDSNYRIVYVSCSGSTSVRAAPMVNTTSSDVDFSAFGTVVDALPTGYETITPVWVANSSSSSGTAPVKVDAYGALTPVPMDSTPTASSTNLMTSGDIKTALDGKQSAFPAVQGTWVQATIGEETSRFRKIGSATLGAWARATAIFVCNFDDGRPGGIFEIALRREANTAGEPTSTSVSFFTTTQHGGNIDATRYNIGYDMVDGACNLYFKTKTTQGQTCYCIYSKGFTVATESVSTAPSSFTNIPIFACAQSQFEVASGSASVPIYVNKDGKLLACTDDFVHDGDVAQTYSSTSEAPVSGKGVAEALATSLTEVEYVAAQSGGGGNLNKTKNGSTTSVLAFMTTTEARSVWTNAKAAVANAS